MARGKDRQTLLSAYPNCAYCAGSRDATTVDHWPSKQMFGRGNRPKGLETPSCKECNQGSKRCESLAAFFAQMQFTNSRGNENELFEQIGEHLSNNHPDLLAALAPTTRQISDIKKYDRNFGVMDLRSPIVSNELLLFGAKCGLALHWQLKKEPLGSSGQVLVMFFSNAQLASDEFPKQLFELLPEAKTLRQGQKTVEGAFAYSSKATTDGTSTAHWVRFGQAIWYQLFVGFNLKIPDGATLQVFSPGCLTRGSV